MTGGGDVDRLLRWYPAAWRRRYGAEMAQLLEDELDGSTPTLRLRASLAWSGLTERVRAGGLAGESRPVPDRVRAGGILVLVAWAVVVLAGGAFAKTSEHFAAAGSAGGLAVARAAYAVVVMGAVVGAVLVVAGVAVALPALPAFARDGGWVAVRAALARASGTLFVAVVATVPLAAWAHHLDSAQRNGADALYDGAFLAWVALGAVTVLLWTAAGIAVARRLELRPRALRAEAWIALGVAAVVAVLTGAIGVRWAAMAESAPGYLVRAPLGTHPVPVSAPLVVVGGLLVVALAAAGYGSARIVGSRRSLPFA